MDDRFCDENDLKESWKITPKSHSINLFLSELLNYSQNKNKNKAANASLNSSNSDENCDKQDTEGNKLLRINDLLQIIYYILNRSKRTPLQILIGFAIYNTCKSRLLITSLNHLGLCISYDELQHIRTGFSLYTLISSGDFIP